MEQNIMNQISDLIKTATSVAFNPKTNSICVLTPHISGNALSFRSRCYTGCTRAEIECALDASGMHFSNHTDQHGLVMFEILPSEQKKVQTPQPADETLVLD